MYCAVQRLLLLAFTSFSNVMNLQSLIRSEGIHNFIVYVYQTINLPVSLNLMNQSFLPVEIYAF